MTCTYALSFLCVVAFVTTALSFHMTRPLSRAHLVLSAKKLPPNQEKVQERRKRNAEDSLEYFEATADPTVPKLLTLSLLVIPAILGWWFTRPVEKVASPVQSVKELNYDEMMSNSRKR